MTTNKDLISDHVRSLIKNIHTDNLQKKVFVIAAAIELLRRAQLLDKQAVHALVNFYSKVSDVPWERIQFSFTQAVSGRARDVIQQYVHEPLDADKTMLILLKAVAVFSDVLVANPDDATQEVFDAVVAELADTHLTEKPEVSAAPVIFQPAMIDKCFKAVPVDEKLCETMKVRPVLYTGRHGVRHRGFIHESSEAPGNWLLLETGEVLYDVDASRVAPLDCAAVPTLLSCYLTVFLGYYAAGEFTVDFTLLEVDLASLVNVFDKHHEAVTMGATGPIGASMRFPVPDTNLEAVIDAAATINGPYAVSRLMRHDVVLMRHEQPRENTPSGIYLFPQPDRVIILRAE